MSTAKPPNVLVLVSPNDSADSFSRIEETLQSLLAFERYIIYPLTFSEVLWKVPWKDNCVLLVVPCIPAGKLPHEILLELDDFLVMGGKFISSNFQVTSFILHLIGKPHCIEESDTNEALLSILPSNSDEPFYSFRFAETPCERYVENDADVDGWTVASLAKVDHSETSTDDGGQVDTNSYPCTWFLANSANKCACVVSFHELMIPEVHVSKMSMLEKIKGSGRQRHEFLRRVLEGLGLECSLTTVVMPSLSNVFVAVRTEEDRRNLVQSLLPKPSSSSLIEGGGNRSAIICTDDYTAGTPVDLLDDTNESTTLVITKPSDRQLDSCNFNHKKFYSFLRTGHLGKCLLMASVVTSTQTFFVDNIPLTSRLPVNSGVVFVAGQQTKGKGRGDNVWISPKGCLMFSIPLIIPSRARIVKRLSILQHLVALSVVTAIRTKDGGYKDLPIMIKWPNDIYYKKEAKLGGIIVNTASLGRESYTVIGCGVNFNNQFPTVSLNDCIRLYNKEQMEPLPLLGLEETLATILDKLEIYLALYEEWGFMAIERLYYQYWMHNDAKIVVSGGPNGDVSAKIIGINDYGFLKVRDKEGKMIHLQPDGNTFDIMKGLIRMKVK